MRNKEMSGIVIAVAFALLTTPGHAQTTPTPGQCDQVKSAIAQYGLAAARKDAMENRGLSREDIRTIEQSCGISQREGRSKKR